jgi:hypothetical protein
LDSNLGWATKFFNSKNIFSGMFMQH